MELADQLAAHLDAAAVLEHDALDAAAGPVARLEDLDVRARAGEVARRGQAGEAGAEDEDVGHAGANAAGVVPSWAASASTTSSRGVLQAHAGIVDQDAQADAVDRGDEPLRDRRRSSASGTRRSPIPSSTTSAIHAS